MKAEREKWSGRVTAKALRFQTGQYELAEEEEICRIILVSGGSFTLVRGGESLLVNPGCVLLLGPGLGGTAQSAARATETRTLVQQLLPGFAGAAVLDADGLNAAAQLLAEGKPFPHPAGELVVTPHPGEMARLTGLSAAALAADREGIALRYAKVWNAVVVLKGAHTVIAGPDGRCAVNPTGNPGLSRGGSGDVLAGMTSALLACGLPAFEAAACAVYLHGAAADRAAALHGETGMLPHDLLDALGTLFAENGR